MAGIGRNIGLILIEKIHNLCTLALKVLTIVPDAKTVFEVTIPQWYNSIGEAYLHTH